MHRSLKFVKHRPWALPRGPWIMAQSWHDLLFAHWKVPAKQLRKLLPDGLRLDLFKGEAWISVVPFTMSGVRLRGTPAVRWLSAFPELNVRAYVTVGAKPGVWFFSLDAANRAAVEIARRWFCLPYFHAQMRSVSNAGEICYTAKRCDRRGSGERLEVNYRGTGVGETLESGTLEYFLLERYCLYAQRPDGTLLRGEIHHQPWSLRLAEASFSVNTMTEKLGIRIAEAPALLHYARRQDVIVWRPQVVRPQSPLVEDEKDG